MILQIEKIIEEPSFKNFDQGLLISYIFDSVLSDLRTEKNQADLTFSINEIKSLKVTSSYFAAAEKRYFYQYPYISSTGEVKFYGQDSVYNLM